MNAERPVYEKREFYGPLELKGESSENRYHYMLEHPDDPTKLVRTTNSGLFQDKFEMDKDVKIIQHILQKLEEQGINHVNPSYIDETSESGQPYLLIVVDRLHDATDYSKLIENGNLTDDQREEADYALGHMYGFLKQAVEDEDYVDEEMLRLDQFVYDQSQPKGKRMVLVDVEPIGGTEINMSQDSMDHGYPTALASITTQLVADTVELAKKTGATLESTQSAIEVIKMLPGNSVKTQQMKNILLHALIHHELTPQFLHLLDGASEDEGIDDEDF